MARLLHIAVMGAGFKGGPLEQSLTGADLFVGPNGSGKSSRLLAILAARTNLAESPADPAREYLGPNRPTAEVALRFEGGDVLRRDLSKGGTTNEGKRANIDGERLMGPHVVRWDLADFGRATDKDRALLLERVCNAAGAASAWNGSKVDAFLRKEMKIERGAGLAGDHPLTVAMSSWSTTKPVGTWLAERAKWMDGEGKEAGLFASANAAQKTATTEASAAAAKLDEIELPGGTLAAKRAELAEIVKRGDAAKVAIAAAEGSARRAQELLADGESAALALADAEDAVTRAETALTRARAAAADGPSRAAIVRAEAALAAARTAVQSSPDPAALAADVERLRTDLLAKEEVLAKVIERAEKAEGSRARAADALSSATGTVDTLSRLLTDASGACRHCAGDDPLGLGGKLEEARARVTELTENRDGAARLLDTRRAAVTEARTAGQAATTAWQEAKRAAESAASTRTAAERAVADAEASLRREDAALRTAATVLTDAVGTAERAYADAVARVAAARQARATAEERLTQGPGPSGDLDTLRAEKEALGQDWKRVASEVELFVRQEERQQAHQQAVAKREAAVAHFEVVKALKKALGEFRAAVATEAYGPIQSAADEFLREAGIDMQVQFRDESDFGALVRQRDGSRPYVTFWALSGAQKAEFSAALAVALAKLTKSPWPAVVLDGMEAIEERHLLGLVRACGAMVQRGELANFVGALMSTTNPDPTGAWVADMGVTVHWLGDVGEAAA